MDYPATKGDVRDLREEIRQGFAGVHKRQDVTNGRLGAVETVQAGHVVQIKNLERETFGRTREAEKQAVTRRDVTLVGLGVACGAAVLQFLSWIGPVLAKAAQP